MNENAHDTALITNSGRVRADKKKLTQRKLAKLYDIVMILILVELAGCGGMLHRFLSIGDYSVEKFIRGVGGVILFLGTGVLGGMLLFATSAARSTDETAKRKMIGVVLLFLGVSIMFIRFYLSFHYAGRKEPY